MLTQEATDFNGQYYQLRNARNEPKGPQRPHIPICIGGGGERRTLRTAARYAQHWNFGTGTPAEFAHKRDVLFAHCADIGRDPKEITLSTQLRWGPEQGLEELVETTATLGEEGLDLMIVYLQPPLTPAVLAPLSEALAPLA
jgi:alkanesulfonate monooxygenase SsuD/methylene tetrahydromethanopterin reductase-like flavin-dependent oxidoreductase (luciferase family)